MHDSRKAVSGLFSPPSFSDENRMSFFVLDSELRNGYYIFMHPTHPLAELEGEVVSLQNFIRDIGFSGTPDSPSAFNWASYEAVTACFDPMDAPKKLRAALDAAMANGERDNFKAGLIIFEEVAGKLATQIGRVWAKKDPVAALRKSRSPSSYLDGRRRW